ncbi:hypothetical protein ODR04_06640, partial [Escherichia coli]|nr:hypothetical protein [Escherichia coli]
MVPAIRCHRQNMKTSIINGSEVSRLSVAIQLLVVMPLFSNQIALLLENTLLISRKRILLQMRKGNTLKVLK